MTAATVVSTRLTAGSVLAKGRQDAELIVADFAEEVATASIDEVGDVVVFGELPWNAKIKSILIYNDDLDAHATPTLAADVGLFKVDANGTATVLDADAYASAITTLQSANKTGVEVAFESGVKDINEADSDLTVMEDGGLSAVPLGYRAALGLTVTTEAATAAAGTVKLVVKYTL